MKTIYRAAASTCGAALLAVLIVPAASACGLPTFNGAASVKAIGNSENPLDGGSPEMVLRDQQSLPAGSTALIVGMWKITELSMGNTTHVPPIPDGTQIDFGYAQWHSDGTEFYNSGGFAPATQNYCLGVWLQTGNCRYQVNHLHSRTI